MSSPFRDHRDHALALATYGAAGAPANVALECEDCALVMADHDLPHPDGERWLDHAGHDGISVTATGGIACLCGAALAGPND